MTDANHNTLRVTVAQFEGIENTPALPLAAGVIVATAKKNPLIASRVRFDIVVPRRPLKEVVEHLKSSDLLGFSLYPWNYEYSLAVIENLHSEFPEIPIVLGGPSLPKREDAVAMFLRKHPAITYLILGEAEHNFSRFLCAFLNEDPLEKIPSLAYRNGDQIQINSLASRVKDFSQTSSPYLDGTFETLLQTYPGFFQMGVLETNRGCPFLCTFCDWSITRKVMEYPLERIYQEIDWLIEKGFSNLCIIDANFGIRKRDADIAAYLAKKKEQTGKPGFCYFYLTKNNHQRNWNTIETFNKAGIHCCVGLAVQDFDDAVLKAIRRDKMQSMETIQLRDICAQKGIPTRNELILGLPKQTYSSFVQTLLQAMPPHPKHDFIIFLCRLLQNTELADPEQQKTHHLQTRRCLWVSPKGAQHGIIPEYQNIIVSTADMPLKDWQATYRFAHVASMAYNKYLLRILLRAWVDLWGLPLQLLLETIVDAIERAAPQSVLGDLRVVLDRYVSSILSEKAYLLPFPDLGERPWELDEALSIAVLLRTESLYAELETHLSPLLAPSEHPKLRELLRFQYLCVPQHTMTQTDASFSWNWIRYHKEGVLREERVTIAFEHPFYTRIPDRTFFIHTYLNLMQSRSITTQQSQPIMVEPSIKHPPFTRKMATSVSQGQL
ncbi:MAG: radical SAM protein [Myxococcota bacterium]|nr:radical SAM protein [Myxococcota bacterium]